MSPSTSGSVPRSVGSGAPCSSRLKAGGGFVDYCPHPVGTWLHCEFGPNSKWPGTSWTRYGEGTYLVSSGATYKNLSNYGSNKHVLTINEMPSHNHGIKSEENNQYAGFWTSNTSGGNLWRVLSNAPEAPGRGLCAMPTGGSSAHNNMPYSVAVPLWRRVG